MLKTKMLVATTVASVTFGALMSASASASAQGWMVNGTDLSGSAVLNTTAPVVEEGVLTIAGITVKCKGSDLDGVAPEIQAPETASASSLIFTGCEAESTNGHTCKLSGGNTGGEIGTLPVSATVEGKSGSSKAVLAHLKPKTGTTFATIAFTGSGCALSGKQPVSGEALVEGPTGQEETTGQEIKAIVTKSTEELKVGGDAASLVGAATLTLTSGDSWSFLGGSIDKIDGGNENYEVNDEEEKTLDFVIPGVPFINVVVGEAKLMYLTAPEGDEAAFKIVKNTCEGLIKAGTECGIEISFTPKGKGRYLSDLLVPVREDGGTYEEVQRVMLIFNT